MDHPQSRPECRNCVLRANIFALLPFCLLLALSTKTPAAQAETIAPTTNSAGAQERQDLMFTTAAYREEALRLIIQEANYVAKELNLPEQLPITPSNLVGIYISPPRMSQVMGTFGNVSTTNYTYFVSVDNKFSFLVRKGLEQTYPKLRKGFLLPRSQMNTNAAFQLATQFLTSVSVDVPSLLRDCHVHIRSHTPRGNAGDRFVPIYWLYWTPKGQGSSEPVADIELFEPTKSVHQLHIMKADYILRKPLKVDNFETLLALTNATSK